MALKGDVTIWTLSEDTNNPETHSIERPDGTTEDVVVNPIIEVEGETYTNAYVVVRATALHLEDYTRFAEMVDDDGNIYEEEIETPRGETKAGWRLNIRYHIYTSEENRLDRWGKPELEIDENEWIQVNDLTFGGKNIIEYCYDWLKTKKGFENLVNA